MVAARVVIADVVACDCGVISATYIVRSGTFKYTLNEPVGYEGAQETLLAGGEIKCTGGAAFAQ